MDHRPENSSRPQFDFTITLGDIAMLIGFMVAIFSAWTNLDKRVIVLEEKVANQKSVDAHQDIQTAQSLDLIRASQSRIETKLDRIIEREANK